MNDFTRGFLCAASVILFGKIMYEKGRRKEVKKEKHFGKFKITIEKTES